MKGVQVVYLLIFFFLGASYYFGGNNGRAAFFIEESIYAYNRKFAGMLKRFIMQAFFLYFIALVHSFHGTQYASAFGNAIEFCQHRFFYQVGKFFQYKTA